MSTRMLVPNDINFNQIVGNYLRKTRMRKGLTGSELGKLMGISQQQISRSERGKTQVSFSYVCNHMVTLGLSLDDFFSFLKKEILEQQYGKNDYIEYEYINYS
ncbi:helix-turn-helix domain-containing protein [Providencia rettgeri]